MKDPKLRLVPPPELDDEPPPSAEELAEAEALRDAIERDEDPVSNALRAAFRPAALPDDANASLVDRALTGEAAEAEPDASDDDVRAAEALRRALEAESGGARPLRPPPELAIVEALRAAARPQPIDARRNELLVATALARRPRGRSITVGRVFAAVATVTALAAGLALFVRTQALAPSAPAAAPAAVVAVRPALVPARSTESLFDATQPFPRTGGVSARIDTIAAARATDLRANRFATWGVK